MVTYTDYLPTFDFSGIVGVLAVIIIMVVFGGIAIGLTFYIINLLRYNKKIIILENVSGTGYEVTGRDKATLLKIGNSGEEVLYLKKRKLYRGSYGKKMGRNTYWFGIGDDGFWYNITLGELDPILKSIGLKPTSVNMRYQYVALQKAIGDRYDKVGFWQKYGGLVAYIGLIAVTGLMMYLLFDQFLTITDGVNQAVEGARLVNEASARIIGGLDNLKSGGSGIA